MQMVARVGSRMALLFLAVLQLVFFHRYAEAVRFELSGPETKCLAEDIQKDVLVVGDFKVIQTNTHNEPAIRINVRVTSPHGNRMHFEENMESGKFAFKAQETGNYMACFWAPNNPGSVSYTIELDWKTGVAAKDWEGIAKKEKVDAVELELRKLEETVESIHEEMLYLREKEAEMRELNETTNARVAWFSILSLLICLSVAGWQLWHLKSFFERKKLL